jgi:hypothetical protein
MMGSPEPVTLDLAMPLHHLNLRLQRSMDVVGAAMRAVAAHRDRKDRSLPPSVFAMISPEKDSHVPRVSIPIQLGPALPRSERKRAALLWILRNGVGDLMTALFTFLLEHWKSATLADLVAKTNPVPYALIEKALSARKVQDFDRLPLPKKLEALRSLCGITPDKEIADLEDRIRSMNVARNCLEHRGGWVDEPDCDREGRKRKGLTVKWVALELSAIGLDGKKSRARPGAWIAQLDTHFRAKRQRFFAAGKPLVFSPQNYVDMAWTVNRYGDEIVRRTLDRLRQVAPKAFGPT